jgi:hypothetical protein
MRTRMEWRNEVEHGAENEVEEEVEMEVEEEVDNEVETKWFYTSSDGHGSMVVFHKQCTLTTHSPKATNTLKMSITESSILQFNCYQRPQRRTHPERFAPFLTPFHVHVFSWLDTAFRPIAQSLLEQPRHPQLTHSIS